MRCVPVALALLLAACPGSGSFTTHDAGQEDPFVQPDVGDRDVPTTYACDTVDILFVIDNSNTMFQEQDNLVASFPSFIAAIEAIQPPIKSYHVGVISTDIGAGPYTYTGSSCHPDGDDGLLQHEARGSGCSGSYPLFLEGPGPNVADDFACIAALGLDGCGYEQQLEAALRALTAQPANSGFVRQNAPLALIFVTDEDDCSAADTSLFDPDATELGDLRTRCVAHLDKLHPVSRYATAFKGLKDDPDRVVVAAITGPPGDVVIDPDAFAGQQPICSSTEFGEAAAGNRFAELVEAFGERGVQSSLCSGDLAQSLGVIGQAIERVCLK